VPTHRRRRKRGTKNPGSGSAVETWLGKMRDARRVNPAVRLIVVRDRPSGVYAFDIDDRTDLAALVQRIDATCRSAGFTNYELRALGRDGRAVGSEQVDLTTSPPRANRGRKSTDEPFALQLIVEYGRLLSQP